MSREKVAFLLSLHTLMMGDEGLGKAELAQLGEAIRAVYAARRHARGRAAARVDAARRAAGDGRATTSATARVELAALLRNLAMRLSEWCGEGTYAYLLDRPTTVPADSPLVVFDTRRCPQDVLRPGDVLDHGVRHHAPSSATGARTPPARRQPARRAFAGRSIMLIDEAWHLVAPPRDRRVRQRPRAAAPATSGSC